MRSSASVVTSPVTAAQPSCSGSFTHGRRRISGRWRCIALGGIFIGYAIALYAHYSDRLAHRTFRYSILYLALLFAALLADHYLQ